MYLSSLYKGKNYIMLNSLQKQTKHEKHETTHCSLHQLNTAHKEVHKQFTQTHTYKSYTLLYNLLVNTGMIQQVTQ